MRHAVDPRQGRLFDPFDGLIPPLGRDRINEGWQAIFRQTLLALMPVAQLGRHFHPVLGRPTKELYSVAGLLFLQELNNWTNSEAVEAYLFRTDVQFALNLEPGLDEMCERTFERYRAKFIDDELAIQVMDQVTTQLIGDLQLAIDQQRLDSTHVLSNMATLRPHPHDGRRQQTLSDASQAASSARLRRAGRRSCGSVTPRHRPSCSRSRAPPKKSVRRSRQQVAEDMHELVVRFAGHAGVNQRSSYLALVRVFQEQCKIVEAKVQVRATTGGDCMQNPSDLEATYDGKKGPGYQAQLVETCSTPTRCS